MEQKIKINLTEIKRLEGLLDAELLDIERKLIENRENPRVVRKQIDSWFEWVDQYEERIECLERQNILLESFLPEEKDV